MTDEKNKIPKEAHAYTPGLKVKRFEAVKKTRRLPIHGKVFVNEGDSINYEAIVAKTELSGNPEIVKASRLLNVEPEVLPRYMLSMWETLSRKVRPSPPTLHSLALSTRRSFPPPQVLLSQSLKSVVS